MGKYYTLEITWKDDSLTKVMKFLCSIIRLTEFNGLIFRDDLTVYQDHITEENKIVIETTWSDYIYGKDVSCRETFITSLKIRYKSLYKGKHEFNEISSYTGF